MNRIEALSKIYDHIIDLRNRECESAKERLSPQEYELWLRRKEVERCNRVLSGDLSIGSVLGI